MYRALRCDVEPATRPGVSNICRIGYDSFGKDGRYLYDLCLVADCRLSLCHALWQLGS